MWVFDEMAETSRAHTIGVAVDIDGPVEALGLQAALDIVSARHLVLRCTGVLDEDARLWMEDTGAGPRLHRHGAVPYGPLEQEIIARPVDLVDRPAWRAHLWSADTADRHTLLLMFHHAILDDESIGILIDELQEAYAAAVDRRTVDLPAAVADYRDYTTAMRELADAPPVDAVRFWRSYLAGAARQAPYSADHTRPRFGISQGAEVRRDIDAVSATALRELASVWRVTPFAMLVAVLAGALAEWGGRDTLTLGVAVNQRELVEPGSVAIGMYSDLVVLRLAAHRPLARLAEDAFAALLDALDHVIPYASILHVLRDERAAGAAADLAPVTLALTRGGGPVRHAGGTMWRLRGLSMPSISRELGFVVREEPDRLHVALTYAQDVYCADRATRLLDTFVTTLTRLPAELDQCGGNAP